MIDRKYFENYAGRGRPYSEVFEEHTYAPECIEFVKKLGLERHIKSIAVLGTATGEVLRYFDKELGIKPYGCEIEPWAHSQIPRALRGRIQHLDMRDYLEDRIECGDRFDLIFSNAFVYIPEDEIPALIAKLAKVSDRVHFRSSFEGDSCEDPYRCTLRTLDWWDQKFVQQGFRMLKNKSFEKVHGASCFWAK